LSAERSKEDEKRGLEERIGSLQKENEGLKAANQVS
jgi:uncharacterized small protein (DUF1192 family)